jgi:hypothetical protein
MYTLSLGTVLLGTYLHLAPYPALKSELEVASDWLSNGCGSSHTLYRFDTTMVIVICDWERDKWFVLKLHPLPISCDLSGWWCCLLVLV